MQLEYDFLIAIKIEIVHYVNVDGTQSHQSAMAKLLLRKQAQGLAEEPNYLSFFLRNYMTELKESIPVNCPLTSTRVL